MQVEEIFIWEKKNERKTGKFRYSMTITNSSLACVAGGIRERASSEQRRSRHIPSRASPAREFASGEAASEFPNLTRLFTNPLTASPLALTASLPKQEHSRAKSHQLRRLRLGKHQDSRENKTNCFPRSHTLSV